MKHGITHESKYRGYELNKTKKGNKGFYTNMLDRLIDLSEAVVESKVFTQPRAFHLTLDDPCPKKMLVLSNYLNRAAVRVADERLGAISSRIFYFAAHEKRKKEGGEHVHLYLYVDSWGWFEVETLKRSLQDSGFAADVKVRWRKIPSEFGRVIYHRGTGEIVEEKPMQHRGSYHDLKRELFDFIERASYGAKVMTKKKEGRKYTSSHLPDAVELPQFGPSDCSKKS